VVGKYCTAAGANIRCAGAIKIFYSILNPLKMLSESLTKQEVTKLRAEFIDMIDRAKKENLFIYCSYQQIWFSPWELEEHHANRKFLWNTRMFQCIDPLVRIQQLKGDIEIAQIRLLHFENLVQQSREYNEQKKNYNQLSNH
jgi:hypothetical protein